MRLSATHRSLAAAATLLLCGTGAASAAGLSPAQFVQEQKAEFLASAPGPEGRIFGGREAEDGEYPWQVGLMWSSNLSNDPESQFQSQFCGGSLIKDDWVLTAAHCVHDGDRVVEPGEITALTGTNDLRTGVRRVADKVISYPGYNAATTDSDLALIHLAPATNLQVASNGRPFRSSDKQLVLPGKGEEIPDGARSIVTGWGIMEDGYFPYRLMETNISVVNNRICNQNLQSLLAKELAQMLSYSGQRMMIPMDVLNKVYGEMVDAAGTPITANMVCAGTASGNRDSCNGDSGGPLMIMNPDGSAKLIGIVSWGAAPLDADIACGQPQLFGYYTNVSQFTDWIEQNAR